MTTTTPDLVAVKHRQRQAWESGDYAAVAARIVLIAEQLADAADLRAGATVLDVATGSGNAALAAARCGCEVTGVDYVPELLERGRRRRACRCGSWRATPSACRSPTPPSTRCCPASG